MSVDLMFNRAEAVKKGVKFETVMDRAFIGDPDCEEDWATPSMFVESPIGERVICPNGAEGFALCMEAFQCKNINQEIKEWFLENLESSRLSC